MFFFVRCADFSPIEYCCDNSHKKEKEEQKANGEEMFPPTSKVSKEIFESFTTAKDSKD